MVSLISEINAKIKSVTISDEQRVSMTTSDKTDSCSVVLLRTETSFSRISHLLHAIHHHLQLKKMSSLWWTSLLVFAGIFAQGNCKSTAFPDIPSYLLECYTDYGIYHRANRMPNSFDFFLDLVRKLEDSRTSRNMNARELSMALLHFLKLDGIRSTRSHTKYYPDYILPLAPSGSEYFKHRLTLVGLVPKIDSSYLTIINETLTATEMCNLHFMLSYSIDPYKREDERCSPLFEEYRRGTDMQSRADWHPYRHGGSYYVRHRRHVDHEEKTNRVDAGVAKQRKATAREAGGQTEDRGTDWKIVRKRSSVDESSRKSDAEEILVGGRPGKAVSDEKDKFTIGDQELLSAGEEEFRAGMQSLVQMGTLGRQGGRAFGRTYSATNERPYSGVIPGVPLSDCPVVNGVITTPFGSLAIGSVIAGIAAGLNPEEIPPMKLGVDMTELESSSDRVKNVWAATLAGSIADTISSPALLDTDSLQILKGGWNDSSEARWYLLASNQFAHMTEVGLRGSLDGLLLGLNAKEWTGKFPNFKLSQLLETYYDCCWGTVGARHRVQLRAKFVPDEDLRKQVYLMSLVLKKQKTQVLTVLDYRPIAREAVANVIQHIQTMDVNDKSYIGSFVATRIHNSVNMIAVVDSSWGYENLNKIFQTLRNARVAITPGNNLTVLCGKDGQVLASSDSAVDFYSQFSRDMLLENCTRGMNLPLIFDTLDANYRKLLYDEKTSLRMNTDAQVVLLLPFDSLLQDNLVYVAEKSANFRRTFPDVRLIIAPNGRSETFLQLLNSSKDLFPIVPSTSDPDMNSARELADGVKQSYQRISRPSCGSYFDDDSPPTETRVTKDISPGNVVYYRLLPQYFYTQKDQATITIKSKLGTPLTVCYSREMDRPTGPAPRGPSASDYGPGTNPNFNYSPDFPPEASPYGRQTEADGPVECRTITSDPCKIELNDPCQGASSLSDCNPLYISLTAPLQETVSIMCQTCRLPVNAQYEISVTGLVCYNGVARIVLAPFLLALLLILYFV